LFDKKQQAPFIINSTGTIYQFARGNYICTFDGKTAIGFYNKEDKGLTDNLIANRNAEMDDLELSCKCFIQDYMNRVVDKRLIN
jgi:hypothetical protein